MDMILKFKSLNLFRNGLIKNFGALAIVQSTNFLIPLVTFPYLIRVVGTSHFGSIAYCMTILTYLSMATDYGFNMTATRKVALIKDDTQKLSKLFSSVFYTKSLIYCICLLISLVLVVVIPQLKNDKVLFLTGLLLVFGNALIPTWFFQGLEKMKYITYANVVAKILQLFLLLVLITKPSDYIWVLAIYGLSNILSGLYGYGVVQKQYLIKIGNFCLSDVIDNLKQGWPIFSSNILAIFIINGTVLIVGYYVSNEELGYYSVSEKIIVTIWSFLTLFVQVIYPRACKLASESHTKLVDFLLKTCLLSTFFVLIGCTSIYVFADQILYIVTGHSESKTLSILRLMSVVPLIVVLNIPPVQFLLVNDLKKRYMYVIYLVALLNLIFAPILISRNGLMGAAQSVVLVQSIMTIAFYMASWGPYRVKSNNERLVNRIQNSLPL